MTPRLQADVQHMQQIDDTQMNFLSQMENVLEGVPTDPGVGDGGVSSGPGAGSGGRAFEAQAEVALRNEQLFFANVKNFDGAARSYGFDVASDEGMLSDDYKTLLSDYLLVRKDPNSIDAQSAFLEDLDTSSGTDQSAAESRNEWLQGHSCLPGTVKRMPPGSGRKKYDSGESGNDLR